MGPTEELYWSDDESDYKIKLPPVKSVDNERPSKAEEEEIVDQVAATAEKMDLESIIVPGKLTDYHRSKDFKGDAKTVKRFPGEKEEKISLPYLPAHIVDVVGPDKAAIVWQEFLLHGADDSEMIENQHVVDIGKKLNHHIHFPLVAFDFSNLDEDEYIEYKDVMAKLAKAITMMAPTIAPPKDHHSCCSTESCKRDSKDSDNIDRLESITSPADRNLFVAYERIKLLHKGKIRNKHLLDLMEEAGIKYDVSRLPESFWRNRRELLIPNFDTLSNLANAIRTDLDIRRAQDPSDVTNLVTEWMRDEFKSSEIMLFKHHFERIDVDRGGTIDAQNLQDLTESLGSKLSLDQAQSLIAQFDSDRSGAIDFAEFMTLMFKLKKGTLGMENSSLTKIMVEARYQIKIFEEIENLEKDPPLGVKIGGYGGAPLRCDFVIRGPEGTPYRPAEYTFVVTFLEGYPYRCPDVYFTTRVMAVNAVIQFNGDSQLPHLKFMWDRSWSLRGLVDHVSGTVLGTPNLKYVDPDLLRIAKLKAQLKREEEKFEAQSQKMMGMNFSNLGGEGGDDGEAEVEEEERVEWFEWEALLRTCSRTDQAHVEVLTLYLTDKERYERAVAEHVRVFNRMAPCAESPLIDGAFASAASVEAGRALNVAALEGDETKHWDDDCLDDHGDDEGEDSHHGCDGHRHSDSDSEGSVNG